MADIQRHAVDKIDIGEATRKRSTHYYDQVVLVSGGTTTVLKDVAINDSIIEAFHDAEGGELFVVQLKWNQHRVVAVRSASGDVAIPETEFRQRVRREMLRAPLYVALMPVSALMSFVVVGVITTPMLARQLYRGTVSYRRKLDIAAIRQAVQGEAVV